MTKYPLLGELQSMDAAELAARLCSAGVASVTRPFWADGGVSDGSFAPGRHILAAHPSRVGTIRVESLPFRGLAPWLRQNTPITTQAHGLIALGLSYDTGRCLEHLPSYADCGPELPDVVFAEYPAYLISSTHNGPWELWALDADAAATLIASLDRSVPAESTIPSFPTTFEERMDWLTYAQGIENVLQAIHAGEIYQANIARRIEAPMEPSLTPSLYLKMRQSNPSAYGTLWCIGERSWIASSSPECLFTYSSKTRAAHSYPIKGTRARGASNEEDQELETELRNDPKELAEHVMIVDLVRNDLGRVCQPGSVHVEHLAAPYRLPTVHHLVSDIAGVLSEDLDVVDLLTALFPGGSITGAPKIAAMQKIEEIEGVRRGFYTGSVGIISPDGDAHFNILIRTCIAHDGRLYYQTGGGIVADSTAENEWNETCTKAQALTSLFDTEASLADK
jgi:para-aminobenzoate synthetase component 1